MAHYLVTRSRTLAEAGGRTIFFSFMRRSLQFLRPDQVPDFEGDQAWFEIKRVGTGWSVRHRTDEHGRPL